MEGRGRGRGRGDGGVMEGRGRGEAGGGIEDGRWKMDTSYEGSLEANFTIPGTFVLNSYYNIRIDSNMIA